MDIQDNSQLYSLSEVIVLIEELREAIYSKLELQRQIFETKGFR